MTTPAHERAQRILGGQLEVLDTMTGRTIKASEIMREILAAEEDAYLAGYREAKSRWDGTNDGDDYEAFKAWLQSRGAG